MDPQGKYQTKVKYLCVAGNYGQDSAGNKISALALEVEEADIIKHGLK